MSAVNGTTSDASAEGYQPVLSSLSDLERDLGERGRALSTGEWSPGAPELEKIMGRLAEQVAGARREVGVLQQSQRAERRQLAHDMRVSLGAIAGWAHVLRLEQGGSNNVARAADVLERNVRTLAMLVESLQS
jgi:hypothetical protein